MSNIIQLTETARLRVEQDDSPECPRREWHMVTGFVKIGMRGDSRLADVPAVYDDTLGISDAHYRFGDVGHGAADRFTSEDLTVRWARAFHGVVAEYDSEHGGYWWVHEPSYWGEVENDIPLTFDEQGELIKSERQTYQQWADGEVYGVILERASAWVKTYENGGDSIEGVDWVESDSLWGCHLDDTYTAQAVAGDNFELEDDERAALGLPEPTVTNEGA